MKSLVRSLLSVAIVAASGCSLFAQQPAPLTWDEVMDEIKVAEIAIGNATSITDTMDDRLEDVSRKLAGSDPAVIWFTYMTCRSAIDHSQELIDEARQSLVSSTLFLNSNQLGLASLCAWTAFDKANTAFKISGAQNNDISNLEAYASR